MEITHKKVVSVSSEGGCLFVWLGTQGEADDRLPEDAKESNSLVQTFTESRFSLLASSASLAVALLFLFRQFLNKYVKELLHLLHWKKHRKQLGFLNVFV